MSDLEANGYLGINTYKKLSAGSYQELEKNTPLSPFLATLIRQWFSPDIDIEKYI